MGSLGWWPVRWAERRTAIFEGVGFEAPRTVTRPCRPRFDPPSDGRAASPPLSARRQAERGLRSSRASGSLGALDSHCCAVTTQTPVPRAMHARPGQPETATMKMDMPRSARGCPPPRVRVCGTNQKCARCGADASHAWLLRPVARWSRRVSAYQLRRASSWPCSWPCSWSRSSVRSVRA